MQQTSNAPLAGIKVLDLSRVLAGPWATMTLADFGATVWKIEDPRTGDDTRAWSPPSLDGISTYYLCANRGKRSITVNLKDSRGAELVRRLARKADVFVENFKTGTVERLGLDYARLSADNAGLVYCSISGYGRTGPDAQRPGYDFIVQAESGLMSITGEAGGSPMRTGVAIADVACGMVATQSILAALHQRQRTGKGQYIDVSLFDTAVTLLINVASGYINTGQAPKRYGNAHPTVVPYQIFDAADGPFALGVGNDRQFRKLCIEVIGRPDMADDGRFVKSAARVHNRDALLGQLEGIFRGEPRQYWMERLAQAGVPAGIVKTVDEVFSSRVVRERGIVQQLDHPVMGKVAIVRPPHGLDNSTWPPLCAPPLLGQDTDAVLAEELELSAEELAELKHGNVLCAGSASPASEGGVR